MTASPPLTTIQGIFDQQFAPWDITLPAESMVTLQPGSITSRGWTINYLFGKADGLPYLEYFASHRMTNDTLNRIYADGRRELIGYCQELFPADDPQTEAAYYQHNRQFYEEVKRKGLW